MFTQSCERGEWWEVGARITVRDELGRDTRVPLDLTGCEVSVVVRRGKSSSDAISEGYSTAWIVDNQGLVAAGGRNSVAEPAYGTITITKTDGVNPLPGWPQMEQFKLEVGDHT